MNLALKLRIKDKVYDQMAAREQGHLGLLRDMVRETGIGKQTLERRIMEFSELDDPADMFEKPELLEALIALAWLCKRHAGEEFTLKDAEQLEYTDLVFVKDDGEPLTQEDLDRIQADAVVPMVASGAGASRGRSNGGKSSKSGSGKLVSAPL